MKMSMLQPKIDEIFKELNVEKKRRKESFSVWEVGKIFRG